MKSILKVMLLHLVVFISFSQAQTGTIQGVVTDSKTGQPLANANVLIESTRLGTSTDQKGAFRLENVASGERQVVISYIGYEKVLRSVRVTAAEVTTLTIKLEPTMLESSRILITSTRYEKSIDEIPIPVAIVEKEKILETAPLTLADAMDTQPGVTMGRDGVWSTRLNIRGLSRTNLVTLVDGNRVDTATDLAADLSMVDLNDVERIEVIRGGGSSLYGTGAIGGVINIITREGYFAPEFYVNGAFQGSYGSVNELGAGNLALMLGAQKWYLRLSGSTRKAGDTDTPAGVLKNSQFSDQNIAVKAGVQLLENHKMRLNYQKYRAEDVGIPGGAPLFPSQADVRYPVEERELFSIEYNGYNWMKVLPRVSLKYFRQNILRDVENIPHITRLIPASGTSPARRVTVDSVKPGATHDVDGVQMQTEWLPARNHYLVGGIDFWQKELVGTRTQNQTISVLSADNQVVQTTKKSVVERSLPVSSYRSLGFYLQDEMSFWAKKLNLTVGGRYDRIRVENELTYNPLYEITNGVRNDRPAGQDTLWQPGHEYNQSWSASLGLLYRFNSRLALTFTTSRSFRAPYLEERYQYIDLGSVVKIGAPDLEPEKGLFFDLGAHYQSSRLSVNVNAFVNRLNDLVVEEPTTFEGRKAFIKANVGSARLNGVDGQIDFRISMHQALYGSFSYVKGEDTKLNVPLPAIPPLNGKIGWRWDVFSLATMDLSATRFDRQDRVASGEIATGGYTYFDLFIILKPIHLRTIRHHVILGVENLTDKSYRNHLATNRGLISAEPGRNVIARWRVEF